MVPSRQKKPIRGYNAETGERLLINRRIKNVIACLLLVSSLCFGCSGGRNEDAYLIRVGELSISLSEFNKAVEAAGEEAFPGEKNIEPAALNDLRMRVLNQLTEELMITAFAKANGISVSKEELDEAVAAIKKDYPDNTFEETLLENAVSYEYWEQKLETRLLVKKVIDSELISKVTITSDDVLAYYNENYPDGTPKDVDADMLNQKIVTHLRQLKAEKVYKDWMETLRSTYPVEVNANVWNRLVGDSK